MLATNTLLQSGDDAAKKALLPGIASGETVATLALTEPNGKWDESGIEATATEAGGTWKISGTKSYVLDGHTADVIIVAARTAAGISLFSVAGDAAGLTRTPLATMDQTRKQAKLELDGVEGTLIGTDGAGWDVLSTVLDLAAVGLAAEQVGGAQMCLETAVQYAKDRVQFGRPIGSFQAIKHKCADMLLEVESAKSAAYYAGWCASELNDELPAVASPGQGLLLGRLLPRRRPRTSRSTVASASPGSTPPTCTSSGRSRRSCSSVTRATTVSCSPSASASSPTTARPLSVSLTGRP